MYNVCKQWVKQLIQIIKWGLEREAAESKHYNRETEGRHQTFILPFPCETWYCFLCPVPNPSITILCWLEFQWFNFILFHWFTTCGPWDPEKWSVKSQGKKNRFWSLPVSHRASNLLWTTKESREQMTCSHNHWIVSCGCGRFILHPLL